MNTNISFDNTEIAFAYKSDKDLKHSHWLYRQRQLTDCHLFTSKDKPRMV